MSDVAVLDWTVDEEIDPFAEERAAMARVDVQRLRRMVIEFRDGTQAGRALAEKARRYFDGDQIDDPMRRALRRSKQPQVIRDELGPACRGILGVVQQAKVDPKAYPKSPGNEDQSDVASKALRFVSDINKLHKIKVDCAESFIVEGVCGAVVEPDERRGAVITPIPYGEAIYDPRSRRADFSDAQYKGVGKWMSEADASRMFPAFADELSSAFSLSVADFGLGSAFEDKPGDMLSENWLDKGKRRIFVVELYHREDQWMRSVFFVGGVLEHGPSPFLDEEGEPMCIVELASCYIDRENQRYGVPKGMIPPQDELNAYGSRALHLSNSRQIRIVTDSQGVPVNVEVKAETASLEAAKPDGVLPAGYEPVPTNDLLSSILTMMASAKEAIVRQAPTPAVLAEASAASSSGRSRLVLQQAGMTEIARALGRFEDFEDALLRQIWLRLRQFTTKPWWVRVSGDDKDGRAEFVGLNQPVGPDGQPLDLQTMQVMQSMGMEVPIQNRLAEIDVDIEVETIPDTANLQAEQFEAIAPLLPQVGEAFGARKALELALALSSIPDKQRIKQILDDAGDDPMAAQMAQMQQQIQQMQAELGMRKAQADIEETQSKTALNQARAQSAQASSLLDAMALDGQQQQVQFP